MSEITLAHISDVHFGRDADLEQIAALEAVIPELAPQAVVIAGDLTQRARHGEFQRALVFRDTLARTAPTLVVPGNHDVEWWTSPFGLLGSSRKYAKFRRYFGDELSPRLELPGAVIVGALTSHGVAPGSMTWNLNDMAVKGHLPASEIARVAGHFARAPEEAVRILVMHHNLLPGDISGRMGLARWREAQREVCALGADVILCGHDHQEGSGQIAGTTVVSTTGTHTSRTRGQRPSAFNLVTVRPESIAVHHLRWDRDTRRFIPSDQSLYARPKARCISSSSS